MGGKWKTVKLGDVIEGLYDGPHQTPKPSAEGPVFLGIKNLTPEGMIDLSEIRHISYDDFPRWTKRVTPNEGDIVFTYEATLNRYAIIPKGLECCLGRRVALIRPNPLLADNNYLYYYFFGDEWRKIIDKNILSGSTVDRIPLSLMSDFEITLPPLGIQKQIADMLSSLDKKIEINNRMNETLETLAKELFNYWFVHYKPFKNIELIEHDIGRVPKDWELKNIGDVLEVVLGGTPSRKKDEYWGGEIPWINSGKVNEFRIIEPTDYISEIGLNKSSTKLLPKGTTVLAITGATLGQISRLEIDCCANQSVIGVKGNEIISSEYVYLWINHMIDYIIKHQTGGAQQHINKGNIENTTILVPPIKILKEFNSIIKPIFDNISLNCFENSTLMSTRKYLLPQLLSGELELNRLENKII
ncbi:restriction endonuclease subunit S [Bacillus sp. B1-b2]|uniref:restriction endonuclease subunit S n=1 Tax=Bacillus sp. B1-b2 TaxID=2653201 RepID=UPI0012618660|nr:restriction endonuclease subunit S [Bacillus sp. B1-b2]KAB7668944.1 hypothetical protein F9279_12120 [Bacillus sp. B1-b2]